MLGDCSSGCHCCTLCEIIWKFKAVPRFVLLWLLCRLQTFCIPGSGTTLNILAGCVFHDLVPHGEFLIALPFAVLCTTAGAMSCYLVSYSTAREVIMRRFPGRVSWLRQKVSEQNSSFFFLL